jgi:uncharacterized protein YukE
VADDVVVNTDALRHNASLFDDVHRSGQAAYSSLVHTLNSIGVVWGEDKFGRTFEENYGKPKDKQLEGVGALVMTFDEIAQTIRAVADAHDRAEQAASGQ